MTVTTTTQSLLSQDSCNNVVHSAHYIQLVKVEHPDSQQATQRIVGHQTQQQ
jgi:hypothetical protein